MSKSTIFRLGSLVVLLGVGAVVYLPKLLRGGGDGPSPQLVERGHQMRADLDAVREAFPDPATLKPIECPAGLNAKRVDWTHLVPGPKPEDWINQLGTEAYLDQPAIHSMVPIVEQPTKARTAKLQTAVEHHEKATHIRVARITELVNGRQTGPDTFTPGYATVWVVTFDRKTREVVCAETFRAENRGSVMKGDIARQVEEQVRTRLGKM